MYKKRKINPHLKNKNSFDYKLSLIMIINHNNFEDIEKTLDNCIKKRNIQIIISLMKGDPSITFIKKKYGNKLNLYILKRIYNNTHIPKLLNLSCKQIKNEWVSFITPGYTISKTLFENIDKCVKCKKDIICLVDNIKANYQVYNNVIIKYSLLEKYLPFDIYKKNKTFIEFWKHLSIKENNNILDKENIRINTARTNRIIKNRIIPKNNNEDLRKIEFRKIELKNKNVTQKTKLTNQVIKNDNRNKVTLTKKKTNNTTSIINKPIDDKVNINVVMISIDDFSNDGFNICEALNESNYNITINHILCKKHPFTYPHKILFKKEVLFYCNQLLKNADIIHLKGDNILVNYKRYFKIPKNKPIITTVSGSMFRRKNDYYITDDNKNIMDKIIQYDGQDIKLRDLISQELFREKYKYDEYSYSTLMTALSCDIVYDNMIYTPPCIKSYNEFNYVYDDEKPIIIGHSPSNKYKKGTEEFIIPAINNLINKGYNIELKLLTGNHQDVIQQKKNITLFIDQCYTGWYGTSLIEAIQYGIPSLCYISSKAKSIFNKFHPNIQLPIIEFLPEINNLTNVLENLINNMDFNELSRNTKNYFNQIHTYSYCAQQWNKLYRSILKNVNNKSKKKVLLYSDIFTSKINKYLQVFKDLHFNVTLLTKDEINNENDIINGKYDLIFFVDISEILLKCINKVDTYLIINDIEMVTTEYDNVIRREKTVLNAINNKKVFFTNKFMKNYINDKFNDKFNKSTILNNYPIYQQIPKYKLPKLHLQDNRIHIALLGTFSDDMIYKNMEDIVEKICEFDELVLHIIPAENNKITYEDCVIHETQKDNELITYLTQFDVGLMFYNIEYDYCNYMDISVANKFYDYLYAELPMIMNNTESYRHLNSIYKCGVNIDYIELNRINEIAKKVKHININIDKYENTLQNVFINNYRYFS